MSVLSPTPQSSSLLPAGASALSSMQEPRIQGHQTLWGSCGIAEGGEPRSPGEAPPALQTQPGSAGPRARHPPPDLPLTHSLFFLCLHTNHFSIQMPSLPSKLSSPLCSLRGASEVSGRLHFFFFFNITPFSSLLRDIF